MDTKEPRSSRSLDFTRPAAAALLLLHAVPIPGLALEIEPRVTVGITHTDNVALATEDEESETIYQARPAFSLSHATPRVTVDADYLMQALRYADLGQSEVYHQYDARLKTSLIPDLLFFEVGGNRAQSIRDPELKIPSGNLPISANRQDRDSYYLSPSFRYPLGSVVRMQGSYRQSWVEYSESDTQGNEQRDANFSIDNYAGGQGLAWALRYRWERTEYDESIPFENQKATAELGFWVSASTRIFGAGGKESAWDMPFDPALEDSFWEAGFAQQIGERLSAEFAAGERSFGSSWRGELDFRFRRGSTSLTYTESPTTEGRSRFRRFSPDDPEEFEDLLVRPGSAQRFVSERLQWRLNLNFQRSGLGFAVFNSKRTQRTEADGTPLPDEEQRGVRASISYRLGPRTNLRAQGSWREREPRPDEKSELIRASLTADYQLGGRTSLSLQYKYDEEDGDIAASTRNYVANTISLYLTRTF